MSNDREKALDVALAAIDKQFGKGSIMRMGEKGSMAIETIQTGALSLVGVAILMPIVIYPFTFTIWLALDLAVHRPDVSELTEAAVAVSR